MIEGQIRGNKMEFNFTFSRSLYTPLSKKKRKEWEKVRQQVCCRLHWPLSGAGSLWGPMFSLPWCGSKVWDVTACPAYPLRFSGRHENLSRAVHDNCWSSSLWGTRWEVSAAVSPFWEGFLGWALPGVRKCPHPPERRIQLGPKSSLWHGTTGSPRLLALLPSAFRAFPESSCTWEGGWRDAPLMQLWWLCRTQAKAGNHWPSEAPQSRAIEPTKTNPLPHGLSWSLALPRTFLESVMLLQPGHWYREAQN